MIPLWVIALLLIGDVQTLDGMKAKEGSCVTIRIPVSQKSYFGNTVWLKNAWWNVTKGEFEGTVLFSNKPNRPPENEFKKRVSVDVSADEQVYSLTIYNLAPQDNGNYSVRIYPSYSPPWISESMSLEVEKNPCQVSVEGSERLEIKMGTQVNLRCSTLGSCEDSPRWFSSSADWTPSVVYYGQGVKTAMLSFTADWSHDGSTFSCWPPQSNDACSSRNITLAVVYAPQGVHITYSPSGALDRITEGHAVSLTCAFLRSNPSELTYSWYRNNTRLDRTSQVYKFSAIKPEERGSYHCQASNRVGPGDSPKVFITVQYGPRGMKVEASCCEEGVKIGHRLTLTCVADAHPKPYRYTWFHLPLQTGGVRPPAWREVRAHLNGGSDLQSLTWERIGANDAGEYKCEAENSINSQNSTVRHVKVLYGPTGLSLSMASTVREFTLVTIHCTVESFPLSNLTLTWAPPSNHLSSHSWEPPNPKTLAGSVTSDSTHKTLTSSFPASVTTAGLYTCQAKNSEGLGNATQELVVNYAPRAVRVMANPRGEVTEKTNLNLTCEAQSNPRVATYTWFKLRDGRPSEVGHGPVLPFRKLLEADTGQYFCMTQNEIGKGNSSVVNITVQYGPRKPVVIHNMTSRGQPIKENAVALTCSSQSYPPIRSYKWYTKKGNNAIRLVRAEQNITIGPDEEGDYYCRVENEISSSSSDSIEIHFNRSYAHILIMAILCVLFFIFIVIIILVYRRRRNSIQQSLEKGSRNGTWETLVMDGIGDPQRSREALSAVMAPPLEPPANEHGHGSKPCSSIHTIYSALKTPGKKQQGTSPGHPHRDGGGPTEEYAIDYASLKFPKERNTKDLKAEDATECVYSKVSRPKRKEEEVEYENVKGAVSRWRSGELDTETSEEDMDVCYSTVSFAAGTGPLGPRGAWRKSSSSDEDDYTTQYSKVRV